MESKKDLNQLDTESGRLDSVLPKKECLKSLIFLSILGLGIGSLIHFIFWVNSTGESNAFQNSVYIILWVCVLLFIFGPSGLVYLYMVAYVNRFSYEITPKFIVIKSGVFTREKTTIPFSRIQNITVDQGIIERIFGLYSVKIETAGMSGINPQTGAARPEGLIPGVKDPSKIENIINKLVHDYTQAPYVDGKLKGKVFDSPDVAFDEFIAYFKSKMVEGKPVKTHIKQLREKLNLTQSALAEKVGLSRQTINYIENGNIYPSIKTCAQLAHALGVSIDQLFEFDESELQNEEK